MLQQWLAVGYTVLDLTDPRFEPQTYRSRDECVTARPTGRLLRNLPTHFNSYFTNVAVWQHLTIYPGFQKLLSTLHLIVVQCLFIQNKIIVFIILSFVSGTKKI